MNLYAIRHRPTGKMMPARMFKQSGAGWSWWEPDENRPGYLPHDQNPRLFYTKQSAQNALSQWLRGPLAKRTVSMHTSYSDFGDEESVIVTRAEPATRVRGDMEIVAYFIAPMFD